jgi:transcription initiation factor TFIIE subunit alpha
MKIQATRVYEIIAELVDDRAVNIIKLLKDRSNVSEFVLAEDLELEINVTRNLLYKLYDLNLVSFTRKKDQKKGWYIHYWTFNKSQVRFLIIKYIKQKIDRLGDWVDREKNSQFYICNNKCIRFNFDQCDEYEYRCPECGELLNPQDNSTKIERLESDLKEYREQIRSFSS